VIRAVVAGPVVVVSAATAADFVYLKLAEEFFGP
jgi:hypothetical protein